MSVEFPSLIEIGPGFWNIRGSFTFCCGLIDIQTHMSIIRLNSGKYLIIDTIQLTEQIKNDINKLTNNGELIEAVIATHPFHTIYFIPFYELYPHPKYYGTPRHLRNINLKWEGNLNDENIRNLWENDEIYMRIPDGAEFINPAENNHFSSVFVFHKPSSTIHVDDTVQYFDNPDLPLRLLGKRHGTMEFWRPAKGLHQTAEGPILFKDWIEKLVNDWEFDNICTAHCGNKVGGARELLRQTIIQFTPQFEELSRRWKDNQNDTSRLM